MEKEADEAASASTSAPPVRSRGPRTDRSKKANMKDVGIDDSGREVNVDADAVEEDEKEGIADAKKELKASKLEDAEDE